MADAQIAVGIPDDVRAAVEQAAGREGLSISDWANNVIRREIFHREIVHHSPIGPQSLNAFVYHGLSEPNTESLLGPRVYSVAPTYPSNSAPLNHSSFGETKAFGVYGLALFSSRIDHGALLLSAAMLEGAMRHFRPRHERIRIHLPQSWLESLVIGCRDRAAEVRRALQYEWEPTGRAAELALDAFSTLSEVTQTSWELQRLYQIDRPRAFKELAHHLELATQQFELKARLVAEIEGIDAPSPASERLKDVQADLLTRAGGGLSLTAAADRLGITRQALHKRAKNGSALALMRGNELVLPLTQWLSTGTSLAWIDGLPKVIRLFETAGGWSALQFLIEQDPNLGTTPRLALIKGRLDDVIAAAEAYLGIEGDA